MKRLASLCLGLCTIVFVFLLSVSPALAGTSTPVNTTKAPRIEVGQTAKTLEVMTIEFKKPFSTLPVVILTPYWKNGKNQSDNIDTIDSITLSGFTVYSKNRADNYFLNWIAIEN
ncbi:H-type lectin domain-containing protein [Okeania sp. KiyG1]|uniref:H-type lectin domain-containing protein n=1 Tax=Okeania sp. KiyG1 TaxID=2720165 RepID=UPI0019236247|nr:H-type lectin domain-containing protein [Okeania sp. KiyG1]GGA03430.1 hypothetical protein CYANOKiyG1_15630 [Okeania sp. KiyG1]